MPVTPTIELIPMIRPCRLRSMPLRQARERRKAAVRLTLRTISHSSSFMRMKDEEWEIVLSVNLTAAFRLSRACLKGMLRKRHGRIIGISSIVGVTGMAGQGNYDAAK